MAAHTPAEKSLLNRRSARDRAPSGGVIQLEAAVSKKPAQREKNGLLIDYIARRSWVQLGGESKVTCFRTKNIQAILAREELCYDVARLVDLARAGRAEVVASGSIAKGREELLAPFRNVVASKKQLIDLRMQVARLRGTRLVPSAKIDVEEQSMKQHRLTEFWEQFHESPRKPELGMTMSGDGESKWLAVPYQVQSVPQERERDFARAADLQMAVAASSPRKARSKGVTPRGVRGLPSVSLEPDSRGDVGPGPWSARKSPPPRGDSLPGGTRPQAGQPGRASQPSEILGGVGEQMPWSPPPPPPTPRASGHPGAPGAPGAPGGRPRAGGALASLARETTSRSSASQVLALPVRAARSALPALPPLARALDERVTTAASPSPGARSSKEDPLSCFSPPWRPEDPPSNPSGAPARRYLRACERHGIVPMITPFVTGHSPKFAAAGQALSEGDLRAITSVIRGLDCIEEIDLEDCALLTDRALAFFLSKCVGHAATKHLVRLSLRRCCKAGQATLTSVMELLSGTQGAAHLRQLDLSCILLRAGHHIELCKALREHPRLLTVCLADTGLGTFTGEESCVTALLGSDTIESLDLSWNSFPETVFRALGAALADNQALRTLRIANCGAHSAKGEGTPVTHFLEQLSKNQGLSCLDASSNGMDFRGAFILDDALEFHGLRDLDVSNNTFGVLGMRALLRLLSKSTSGLERLDCKCCSGGAQGVSGTDMPVFSASNPRGKYTLDLTSPYQRALLRRLYKCCERFGLRPEQAFTSLTGVPPYSHPQKSSDGLWPVPTQGKVVATFTVEETSEHMFDPDSGYDAFGASVQTFLAKTRIQISAEKAPAMVSLWENMFSDTPQQVALLEALSRDFILNYAMVSQFCRTRHMAGLVLKMLVPSMVGHIGNQERYLALMHMPHVFDYENFISNSCSYLDFNIHSPTGHYFLDLRMPADRTVAEQLMLINRWEGELAKKKGRMDVSQHGDHSQGRNQRYQGMPVNLHDWAETGVPESDRLELDYVSSRRPPVGAKAVEASVFDDIVRILQKCDVSAADISQPLRRVAHLICLTCVQVRRLVGICRDSEQRVDLVVTLYFRLVDIYNEELFRSKFDIAEWRRVRDRLGHVAVFPFVQLEQMAEYSFDLAVYEQRLVANVLIQIAAKEGWSNTKRLTFCDADGVEQAEVLEKGMPRSWISFPKMPHAGKLSANYVCSAAARCLRLRMELLVSLGLWELPEIGESDITWTTSLADTPPDVLELVDYLIGACPDLKVAFRRVDGEQGHGQINLREFQVGIGERLEFRKSKGPDEAQRVERIFRYLDPDGSGQISDIEWYKLSLILEEICRCIVDLVQHLHGTYGDAFLSLIWANFDRERRGRLNMEKWQDAAQRVGFFGPVDLAFRFLDSNNNGWVSAAEMKDMPRVLLKLINLPGMRERVPHGGIEQHLLAHVAAEDKEIQDKLLEDAKEDDEEDIAELRTSQAEKPRSTVRGVSPKRGKSFGA